MRAFRQTLTALVLGVTFSGAVMAADPMTDSVATQTDSIIASASESTRQSLQLDIDYDVMLASHNIDTDEAKAELVADVSSTSTPAVSVVDDNNDA